MIARRTASASRAARWLPRAEPNPLTVATMRLTFDESAEAEFQITLTGRQEPLSGLIGLDGRYRTSLGDYGPPAGVRGAWADAQTFVFEYDEVGSIDAYTFRLRFEQDDVEVDVTTREDGRFSTRGRLQRP